MTCAPRDVYNDYLTIRTSAAVDRTLLLPITSSAGQPCSTFGVHPVMPNIKNMYDSNELAFVANVGALVEPVTKADFLRTPGFRVRRFPPSLFAHNIMQRSMHNLDAQNVAAKGVLGRMINRLLNDATPYRSELYSIAGNTKMLEGTKAPDVIDAFGGVIRYTQFSALRNHIQNITGRGSDSAFGETYSSLLDLSLKKTESIGALLSSTTLNATFGTDGFSRQMQQVARLIKLRNNLTTERAVFFTSRGGYDTHNTFNLDTLFGDIDRGVQSLRNELKIQGVWDDVVVLTVSDFGRTLTSNGQGTDHAWGGIHFVAGGKVRGGQILGKYPDSLLDTGSVALGRGRILPTVPWEAMWNGIIDWFGVNSADKDFVLPNAGNFPATDLFTRDQMFRP
jgi:cullin-associated NEDD8-dissociated protein 1